MNVMTVSPSSPALLPHVSRFATFTLRNHGVRHSFHKPRPQSGRERQKPAPADKVRHGGSRAQLLDDIGRIPGLFDVRQQDHKLAGGSG
jgi:hypothetical protein